MSRTGRRVWDLIHQIWGEDMSTAGARKGGGGPQPVPTLNPKRNRWNSTIRRKLRKEKNIAAGKLHADGTPVKSTKKKRERDDVGGSRYDTDQSVGDTRSQHRPPVVCSMDAHTSANTTQTLNPLPCGT